MITGVSSGIGRALAIALIERGYRVYGTVRREEDASSLRALGYPELVPILLDVTSKTSRDAAVARIEAGQPDGKLAALVNNAGISRAGPLELVPEEDLRHVLEVNLLGTILITRALLRLLRAGRGRIVTIGSVNGYLAAPGHTSYCATKFALEGVCDALRLELESQGIQVCLLQPGAVETPIWTKERETQRRMRSYAPPDLRAIYEPLLDGCATAIERRRTIPPEKVVQAAVDALTSPRCPARYRVGLDAQLGFIAARWLPVQFRDALVRALVYGRVVKAGFASTD